MNPILPRHFYIPDVEARDWGDGRIYLYGSMDIEASNWYCSKEYRVFSSDDMVNWRDHGLSFANDRSHTEKGEWLFAPDCIRKNGVYYLLYCGNDGSEGFATSDNPGGPFGEGVPIAGADGDAIDPSGFVDDDGTVYYFWGQGNLRGAKLNPDFKSIDERTMNRSILNEKDDGFHEGSSIRKRNGIYYMVYADTSRGKATSLGYAMGTSPLGPYEKKGILIDNMGCDPATWNNHGSIESFNGQWYVFYHRSSHGNNFSRRVCAEPIEFNDDGTIDEVEMTTQGPGGPVSATGQIDAYRACLLSGRVYPASFGDIERLTNIHNGDWAAYKYLDFGEGVSEFAATVGSMVSGSTIEVRIDAPDGPLLCEVAVPNTGDWTTWQTLTAPIAGSVAGIHAVYLVFRGHQDRALDLLAFSFENILGNR